MLIRRNYTVCGMDALFAPLWLLHRMCCLQERLSKKLFRTRTTRIIVDFILLLFNLLEKNIRVNQRNPCHLRSKKTFETAS
jgi:hypothetical protein